VVFELLAPRQYNQSSVSI